jgi:hypothetical protein
MTALQTYIRTNGLASLSKHLFQLRGTKISQTLFNSNNGMPKHCITKKDLHFERIARHAILHDENIQQNDREFLSNFPQRKMYDEMMLKYTKIIGKLAEEFARIKDFEYPAKFETKRHSMWMQVCTTLVFVRCSPLTQYHVATRCSKCKRRLFQPFEPRVFSLVFCALSTTPKWQLR